MTTNKRPSPNAKSIAAGRQRLHLRRKKLLKKAQQEQRAIMRLMTAASQRDREAVLPRRHRVVQAIRAELRQIDRKLGQRRTPNVALVQRIGKGVKNSARHHAISKMADLLVNGYPLPPYLALALLHGVNARCCQPPLPLSKVEKVFEEVRHAS